MTDNNHIYTAEDIRKYFSGKLSAAEMHAMEKASLDDPFLAEAMEGFEAMQHEPWEEQLAAARLKMQEDSASAKVVPLYQSKTKWWKAAAAILLIGGGAALTYTLTTKKATQNNPDTIAKVTPPVIVDTAATVATQPVQTLPVDSNTHIAVTTTQSAVTKIKIPAGLEVVTTSSDGFSRADSNFVYKPGKPNEVNAVAKNNAANYTAAESMYTPNTATNGTVSSTLTTGSTVNEIVTLNRQEAKTPADDFKKKAAEPSNRSGEFFQQQLNRSFAAQVVTADNAPLPFANINIKSENFGTYADVKGNFRLVSTDSLVTVEVRSVGFLPRTYILNSNTPQNKIVLTEDATAFREKTVIRDRGIGKASRRATLLKDSIVNVEPADGWDNYNTYVSNNIDIPEEILKRDLHGEMEISFTIQPNGAITNIKVDKSLCDNCDEAAARKLIEQGPQWKLKKGKSGKARIKVQF